jgi:hypothetical protein
VQVECREEVIFPIFGQKNNTQHISNPLSQNRKQRIIFFSSIVVQNQKYMPLIEIKNFPSIIEFHKHVRAIDTFDLVGTWIGSTAHQIFINRYKFRLMEQSVPNPFDQKSGIEINLLLNQYIHNVNRHVNSIGTELDFRRFVNAELGIFSKSLLLDYSVEHAEIRQQYFEFLMQHQYKLYRINNLSHQIFATSPRISEKLSTISKASLLKLQQIDGQTISLFENWMKFLKFLKNATEAIFLLCRLGLLQVPILIGRLSRGNRRVHSSGNCLVARRNVRT